MSRFTGVTDSIGDFLSVVTITIVNFFEVLPWIGDDGTGFMSNNSVFAVAGINFYVVEHTDEVVCEPFMHRVFDNRIEELVSFASYQDLFTTENSAEPMVVVTFPQEWSKPPMTYWDLESELEEDCLSWVYGEEPPWQDQQNDDP